MRKRDASASLPKESVLKTDKDCHVDTELNREYVHTIIDICRKYGVKVLWIKTSITAHGRHFYIKIDRPVDAQTANELQYLLGDDSRRVDFNRARIESGLQGWNKLFERIGAILRTVYRNVGCSASELSKNDRLLKGPRARVDFNRARINVGFPEWDKLFELPGR
jgi:hypothetical protein